MAECRVDRTSGKWRMAVSTVDDTQAAWEASNIEVVVSLSMYIAPCKITTLLICTRWDMKKLQEIYAILEQKYPSKAPYTY